MRTVCGQFCGIFGGFLAVAGPLLHERCLSQVVPLCLVPEIALPRATNQCSLCSNLHFSCFSRNFCLFFRGGSNMVAFRQGGRDMAGKIPTTFATSCNRPSALWASQPSLFSCLLISTFVLQFSLFSLFFSNFSSFHPFPSSLPFSCPLFSHNFPAFFLHLLSLPAFSSIFWSSRHVSL